MDTLFLIKSHFYAEKMKKTQLYKKLYLNEIPNNGRSQKLLKFFYNDGRMSKWYTVFYDFLIYKDKDL